jgi:hypothetical protein
MEKRMRMLGPTNNLKVLIKEANDLLIKKEDIVDFIQHRDGTFSIIYFG